MRVYAVALSFILAVSCVEPATHPEARVVTVSALAAFQRTIKDSNSLGNRHNRGLDQIKRRMIETRHQLGRRLHRNEYCAILLDFGAREYHGSAQAARVHVQANAHRKGCPGADQAGQSVASRASEVVVNGQRASLDAASDLVDSVFALPSWDPIWYEGVPTVSEDSALAVQTMDAVYGALQAATSIQDAQTRISNAVASFGQVSAEQAWLIAEVAGVASSSTNYWYSEAESWVDQLCQEEYPENGPSGAANAVNEDLCNNVSSPMTRIQQKSLRSESAPRNRANMQYIDCQYATNKWACAGDFVKEMAREDCDGFFSFGAAISGMVTTMREAYQDIAREIVAHNGALDMEAVVDIVREEFPVLTSGMGARAVVNAAGKVARSSLAGATVALLVLDSAVAMM